MLRPPFAIAALGPARFLFLAALVWMVLCAATTASTAAAAPGVSVRERDLRLVMFAEAGNGYALSVETAGHRQVTLTLSKGGASAVYTTTGQVSRKGIEADFGELGEIDVRFHGKLLRPRRPSEPSFLGIPESRSPRLHCRGRKAQRAFGIFRGTIRFEGEHGFTGVNTSKAQGLMARSYRRVCRREEAQPKPKRHRGGKSEDDGGFGSLLAGLMINTLTAGGETEGRQVYLRAVSLDPDPSGISRWFGSLLIAGTLEHHDGIRIERSMFAAAGANALDVSGGEGKPSRVGVVFPKPLEGRATLLQEQGAPSAWSGSLLARLPGGGGVPMTGPGIRAIFCHSALLTLEEAPCLHRSDALLPADGLSGSASPARLLALQESGSHSQALADVKLSWSR